MSELPQDDSTPPDIFVYMNTLAWMAAFVKRRAEDTEFTEEAIEAQVHVDLKKVLDGCWKPN